MSIKKVGNGLRRWAAVCGLVLGGSAWLAAASRRTTIREVHQPTTLCASAARLGPVRHRCRPAWSGDQQQRSRT